MSPDRTDPRPMDAPPWAALDAWLAGEASEAQRAVVDEWMRRDPRNAAYVASLESAVAEPTAVDVDAAWKRTRDAMRAAEDARKVVSIETRRGAKWVKTFAAAAAVLLVAFLAQSYIRTTAELVVEAPPGQRVSLDLPDGSKVTLNSGSRLTRPKDFTKNREVQLEGEALFTVVHDDAHPFRVRAGNATATDIGTTFVVRAYPELDHVDVGVSEGRVSLKGAGPDSLLLDAGMVGRLRGDGTLTLETGKSAGSMSAWTTGALVFEAVALEDVVAQLRRRFGVPIRIEDTALARRAITTSFERETPDQVLDAIAIALGVQRVVKGDTSIIKPQR